MNWHKLWFGLSYGLGFPVYAFFAPTIVYGFSLLTAVTVAGPIMFLAGHLSLRRKPLTGKVLLSAGALVTIGFWGLFLTMILLIPLLVGPVAMAGAAIHSWLPPKKVPDSVMPALPEI